MKTYYPTPEQFKNPITYIEQLFKEGAAEYGLVKIVPPKEFRPRLSFNQFSD